ncbi:MAG TPA: cytochrome c biogenesis protein CcsA, partial [bacterium]|nr:cytochrome c biogenesis protein CcsA [bacterium]
MTALGSFALHAALVVALYGIIAAAVALRREDPALGEVARRAVLGWSAAVVLAAAALLYALVTRDFSLRFVAETTSRDLSLGYTLTAFWGGHAGSLLLWTLILGLYAVAAASSLRWLPAAPAVTLTLLAVAAFFTAALLAGSPFESLPIPPPDGRGLNPLLRNPWMAFHPPALYLGFVGTTVPFALTVAALVGCDPTGTARRAARSWMRVSWLLLTTGLLFGAKWSYVVLGWGGYWAWDPVENAALMPWLTGAAYLHAAQVAERTGRLRDWSDALVLASFELSILGTFLTRSGVLSSVHAFADSGIGVYLLAFLAASTVLSLILLRRGRGALGEMRSVPVDAVPGREAALLASSVLLAVAAAAVLVGTVYPIVIEAATGDRINVGPPYFNQILIPLVVLLLPLMA